MLDLSGICSIVSPIIAALQSVLDAIFGAFSFLGITAPSISGLINPILGCTT